MMYVVRPQQPLSRVIDLFMQSPAFHNPGQMANGEEDIKFTLLKLYAN
jgi:hypothetical protein